MEGELPSNKGPAERLVPRQPEDLLRWMLWTHVFDALPTSVYQRQFRTDLENADRAIQELGVVRTAMTPDEVAGLAKEVLMRGYVARHDARPTTEVGEGDYSAFSRAGLFDANLRAALPMGHLLEAGPTEAFRAATESHATGSFAELWEERFALSRVLPLNGKSSRLPFGALRDFVLSLLPRALPIHTNTLYPSKISLDAELEALRGRLERSLGPVLEPALFSAPQESTHARHFAIDHGDREVPYRTVEQMHQRIRFLCPTLFPSLLARGDANANALVTSIRQLPAMDATDLEDWCNMNGLDENERVFLLHYLLEQKPTDLAGLERLLRKLITNSGQLRRERGGQTLRPLLIWDDAKPIDSWSAQLLESLLQEDRTTDQALLVQAQDRLGSLEIALDSCVRSAATGELKAGTKAWREALRVSAQVGRYSNPVHAVQAFGHLVQKQWGTVEACVDYVKKLVAQRKTSTAAVDAENGPFLLPVLQLLAPGLLEATSRTLSRGVDAKGVIPEEIKWAGSLAHQMQLYLRHSMGETGVDKDIFAQRLLPLNDLLFLVLSDYFYYTRNEGLLKGAYQRYGKIVGKDVSGAPAEYAMLPVHLYGAAKFTFLKKDWPNCIAFVKSVVDRDSFEAQLQELITRFLRYRSEAVAQKLPSPLREDGLGLEGFAPLQISAERFMQEIVRMGVLAIDRLLLENPSAGAQYGDLRKEWTEQFYRLQGPLSPAQVMNFYLAQTQTARDAGRFDEALLMLDRGWGAIGEDEPGYHRRRLEHNEVEVELARAEALTPETLLSAIHRAVVVEHTLQAEEASEAHNAQRVWEYRASFFEALLRYATQVRANTPMEALPEFERRGLPPFRFDEFANQALDVHLTEASTLAIQACEQLYAESPGLARWAANYILNERLAVLLPPAQISEEQKTSLRTAWEALIARCPNPQ